MKSLVIEYFFPEKEEWEYRDNRDKVMAFAGACMDYAEGSGLVESIRTSLIPKQMYDLAAVMELRLDPVSLLDLAEMKHDLLFAVEAYEHTKKELEALKKERLHNSSSSH